MPEQQQEILEQVMADFEAVKRLQGKLNERIECLRDRIQTAMFINTVTSSAESMEAFDWQQQYKKAIGTLRKFGFAGDALPTLEAVRGAFNEEQEEAISTLRSPTLILVPNVSFAAKVRAIDASGLAPRETYVNEHVFGSVERNAEEKEHASAWQPVVIEGMQEMETASYDNRGDRLRDRIATIRRNRNVTVSGTDRQQYALLQMHALHNGNPVDRQMWTILDGDKALEGNTVPIGRCYDDQVDFDRNPADYVNGNARFRSTVQGDELQA